MPNQVSHTFNANLILSHPYAKQKTILNLNFDAEDSSTPIYNLIHSESIQQVPHTTVFDEGKEQGASFLSYFLVFVAFVVIVLMVMINVCEVNPLVSHLYHLDKLITLLFNVLGLDSKKEWKLTCKISKQSQFLRRKRYQRATRSETPSWIQQRFDLFVQQLQLEPERQHLQTKQTRSDVQTLPTSSCESRSRRLQWTSR